MIRERQTAIVTFELRDRNLEERLPLDAQREYVASVQIDGSDLLSTRFLSPLGDELWRQNLERMRDLSTQRSKPDRQRYKHVRGTGKNLFDKLCGLDPQLQDFLSSGTKARRLVIQSQRPEIHQLPWESMVDKDFQCLSVRDVSIVHTLKDFTSAASAALPPLSVEVITGDGTEERTLKPVTDVLNQDSKRVRQALTRDTAPGRGGDLVHIEAHGDVNTGEILLPHNLTLDPGELADAFKSRKMVLLWSCYSANVQPGGRSAAMALNEAGSTFVISFATPLHYESASEIARRFYEGVFQTRNGLDPESTVVSERSRLFTDEPYFCDWASLTLWLRRPLDLSSLPLLGPRIPASDWSGESLSGFDRLRDELRKHVVPGSTVLFQGTTPEIPIPQNLVEDWGGPVVHLDSSETLGKNSFEALRMTGSPGPHLADRFLWLLDNLSAHRYGLLLWTEADRRVLRMIETLDKTPRNVAIVLTSPYRFTDIGPPITVFSRSEGAPEPCDSEISCRAFIRHILREDADAALDLWPSLKREDIKAADGEFWSHAYWAFIRREEEDKAQDAIKKLRMLDETESVLLQANLDSRKSLRTEAEEGYRRALDLATRKNNPRDMGRAKQEMAYLASTWGDRPLAEELYLSAIRLLEEAPPDLHDSRWSSALGRALRDYADMLVTGEAEEIRLKEARLYLRRALAIHALDGRIVQVAYSFLTWGKLCLALSDADAAEQRFQNAAMLFHKNKNWFGWTDAITGIATVACRCNREVEGLAVLNLASETAKLASDNAKLASDKANKDRLRGKLALEQSKIAMRLGQINDSCVYAEQAIKLLADSPRRREAERLFQFSSALLPPFEVPKG